MPARTREWAPFRGRSELGQHSFFAARGRKTRVSPRRVFRSPERSPRSKLQAFYEGKISSKPLILLGSPGRIRTSDQPVNSRRLRGREYPDLGSALMIALRSSVRGAGDCDRGGPLGPDLSVTGAKVVAAV
jgi:hypothetical protein